MKAALTRLAYGFAVFARLRYGRAGFTRLAYGFAVFGGFATQRQDSFLQSQSGEILTSQASNEALSPQ